MLEREEVCKELSNVINKLSQDETHKFSKKLIDKYNFSKTAAGNISNGQCDLTDLSELELYCITEAVVPSKIKEFFTQVQIDSCKDQKIEYQAQEIPEEFNMIQVTKTQFIGVATVQDLMALRENHMINYNTNTQRAMTYKFGEYVITINKRAVNAISDLYKENRFIPNTITLNVSDKTLEPDYNKGVLSIKNVKSFDIVDGYHRYLGMCRNYDMDNTFDYPTELRICFWSVNEAKQMVWQENHHTKMSKVNAATYNQKSYNNDIVTEINNGDSLLKGEINTNGKIGGGLLASLVDVFKAKKKSDVIIASGKIIDRISPIVRENLDLADRRWEPFEVYCLVYGAYTDAAPSKISSAMSYIARDDVTRNYFKNRHKMLTRDQEVLKEVFEHV